MTYGTSDLFLEHYGLASLADRPGAADMKALGLLGMDLPQDFHVPDPSGGGDGDEDPLDAEDSPEFHQDFLLEG